MGLIPVYNLLPKGITAAATVGTFQKRLQLELKLWAEAGVDNWSNTYSPRIGLAEHPLHLDGSEMLLKKELHSFLDDSE